MSITLSESPFTVDFAQNSLAAKFSCTPFLITGVRACKQFKFTSLPAVGKTITFSFNDTSLTFTLNQYVIAAKYSDQIAVALSIPYLLRSFEDKIVYHYFLNLYYNISAELVEDGLILTFFAKEPGSAYNIEITTNDSISHFTVLSSISGVDSNKRDNYYVYAQIAVNRYKNGLLESVRTPEILLSPDSNNKAGLPLDILRSYFSDCDLPNYSDTIAGYQLHYALLVYKILFAEIYGEDPVVQTVNHSNNLYLINAIQSEHNHAVGLPDWDTFHPETAISSYTQPRNYGSKNDITVNSYKELLQYLYFIFIGDADRQNTYSVDLLCVDGSTVLNYKSGEITLYKNNITRVPISYNALGLYDYSVKEILSYKIKINFVDHDGNPFVFTRTFLLNQKPFFSKEFLLQSRFGVLESFFCENQLSEKTTEGNKVVLDESIEIDLSDEYTLYTARTGYKTKAEMQLLSEAVSKKYNYRVENESFYKITIVPGTFAILDEKEDLQSAEFSYLVTVQRNEIRSENDQNEYLFSGIAAVWDDSRVWGDHLIIYFNS